PVRRGNWRDGLVATLRSLRLQTADDWQAVLAHSLGDADLARLRNVIALQPEVRERVVVREAAKLSWHSLRGKGAGPVMAGVLAPGDTLAADALMQFA